MYDFEGMVEELLGNRPELTREELMRRIAEKKETVGAGYLTDQGALFLVAGDLGVTLRQAVASSDMTIKDLYIGANDVTTVARVLAIYPTSTYKKKDGSEGRYRRLVLFDGTSVVKLTLWDENAGDVEKLDLKVGMPVRVANGYVKQGLDGKPNLSLGKKGKMEALSEADVSSKLVPLSAVTEKLGGVTQEKAFLAAEGVVDSEPRYSEFVRSDGTQGSLFQFGIAGAGGSRGIRMVIWSPSDRPELKPGQRVVVTNVKSRRGTNGDFEIHGDAGSTIILGTKAQPIQLRVAGVSKGHSGLSIIGVGKDRKVRMVEASDAEQEITTGSVIEVAPDSENNGRIICKGRDNVRVYGGNEFPEFLDLATKLKDAKDESSQVMVEVIALSHGTVEDVHLKDGSVVKKGELVVGDDTAEMKISAWRDQSERFSNIQPGERLRISGISAKPMKIGGWVLQMNNSSLVEKLRVATKPSSA